MPADTEQLGTVAQALTSLRAGRPVVVVDDADRENEGDVVLAAETADERWVGWAVPHTSGQDQGRDTVEANLELGVPADAREYGAAAAVLTDLGLGSVALLTNNPSKVEGLERGGVR